MKKTKNLKCSRVKKHLVTSIKNTIEEKQNIGRKMANVFR